MDWGDVIAAVVGLGGGMVATWQATEAKKARRASQQQAFATDQQAREATRAREIAEEALAIAKQTEADRIADRIAEQNARDAPKFDIVPSGRTRVRVTLMDGPPEITVRMARLDIVAHGDERPDVPTTLPLDPQVHRMTPGGSCVMAVDVQIERSMCAVRIELSSQESDGDRTWTWRREVHFPAPPATPQLAATTGEFERDQQQLRGLFH